MGVSRLYVLPMGWVWSLFFCKSLLEQSGLPSEHRVQDRSAVGTVGPTTVLRAQCVDNFFVLGSNHSAVAAAFEKMCEVVREADDRR